MHMYHSYRSVSLGNLSTFNIMVVIIWTSFEFTIINADNTKVCVSKDVMRSWGVMLGNGDVQVEIYPWYISFDLLSCTYFRLDSLKVMPSWGFPQWHRFSTYQFEIHQTDRHRWRKIASIMTFWCHDLGELMDVGVFALCTPWEIWLLIHIPYNTVEAFPVSLPSLMFALNDAFNLSLVWQKAPTYDSVDCVLWRHVGLLIRSQ